MFGADNASAVALSAAFSEADSHVQVKSLTSAVPAFGVGTTLPTAAGAAPPPAERLARYSAKDSALWIACCLPFGSFGSITVGAGSRVASPPPKPLPPFMATLDVERARDAACGARKAEDSARAGSSIF